MRTTGRNRLVRVAELPAYSCPRSPRRFTRPQLLACLALKAYQRQTYRGVADLLGAAELLDRMARKARPKRLFADKGYDAEWMHQRCRERLRVRSFIPPVAHRRDGTAGGKYRSRMGDLPKAYGMRWHVESFIRGLKRSTGSALASVKPNTLDAEAGLRVLAYSTRR